VVDDSAVDIGWWGRNARWLKTAFRILLGVAWLVNGVLKFTSGYVSSFLTDVQTSQANAPSWLSGWYAFWTTQATNNPTLIVYTVGVLEVVLGLALVLGLLRKIAYSGGVILSLLIWAVPEGFGGPYQNGAGGTDVGVGLSYAIGFLGLIVVNAALGPSRWSLDHVIERRFPWWAKLAEFRKGPPVPVAGGS
jgi:uncharacterized membrane protein YphA (DoxX/SURF4 family)